MSLRPLIVVTLLAVKARQPAASDLLSSILNPVLDPVVDTLDSLDPNLGTVSSDAYLNFPQLAAKYGHPAEQYVVHTRDGYRLKVFRLPGKRRGFPILLFHGITDSADTWIIRGNGSLAITLADAGHDVWFGNVRGNKYSIKNPSVALDHNETYWNFTFHEHAVHDLPTTIDLVLNKTGARKLNAIGHSQGTTIFFILLSTNPEYNDKVNLLIGLAPVVYLQHSPPPLAVLLRLVPDLYGTLKRAHQYQIFSPTSSSLAVLRLACSTTATSYLICLQLLAYPLTGYDLSQVGPSFSYVAFKHSPTSTSVKNIVHFGQVTKREKFARFDYGAAGNRAEYGRAEPPEYELERVRAKVVLLTARNDFLSTQPDVARLRRRLRSVVRFVVNPRSQLNHLDYIWGLNMSTYLFPYIFESLHKYRER